MPDQERTETATPKRREEARRKGHVARSPELNTAVVLAAVFAALSLAGAGLVHGLRGMIQMNIAEVGRLGALRPDFSHIALENTWLLATAVAPLLATALAAGLAINLIQVGFQVGSEAVTFKWDNLNPVAGLKRLFSARSFMTAVTMIAKLVLIGVIAYYTIASEFDRFPALTHVDLASLLAGLGRWSFQLVLWVTVTYLGLALLDYKWQHYSHEKSIRMTKQEVKEERRQAEGDPQIKARIRNMQYRVVMHRMMSQVPRSTVVIVNPTHLAVALRYVTDMMPAPLVTAKGRRLIAERIVQIAREHGIPVVQDTPLAQGIFAAAEVGQAIPVSLYQAVSDTLAYVYLRGQRRN